MSSTGLKDYVVKFSLSSLGRERLGGGCGGGGGDKEEERLKERHREGEREKVRRVEREKAVEVLGSELANTMPCAC